MSCIHPSFWGVSLMTSGVPSSSFGLLATLQHPCFCSRAHEGRQRSSEPPPACYPVSSAQGTIRQNSCASTSTRKGWTGGYKRNDVLIHMTVDEGASQTSGNGCSGLPQEAALNGREEPLSKMFLVYYQTVGWNKRVSN